MKPAEQGFTLIELMIGMVMTVIIVGIIYSAYSIQTKIYTEQGKVAEMQQNIRATLAFMQKEARMAGFNPQGDAGSDCLGIHTATATSFGFTIDLNEDGNCDDPGENITYMFEDAGKTIVRTDHSSGAFSTIAEDITDIRFLYMFKPPGSPTTNPDTAVLNDIVAVQVSLLAQAKYPDRNNPSATMSFTLPLIDDDGTIIGGDTVWGPFDDGHSRRLLTTTINLRNMGL